ncbi:hypothetical protein [Methanoculleus sp. UBA303]|jgi:hypothetical protein|uniref:hypothetical protein n=1 Tax=Methanoculleus sp. UBA303 TaxID=1915497 RepID=UPI0025F41F67|nr:hypothetical protein [Methanoculleus sp. UBA303]
MRRDVFPKVRAIPAACCLVIALMLLAAPAMAATTQVNVTKYCDNNYSTAVKTANLTVANLMANYTQVYSNGPLYMQKGTFDLNDTWGDANQGMVYYGEHNGTYVSNITGEVGGMSDGDELWVLGIDKPITRYFGYDNVYTPNSRQGDMILAWWDNETGLAGNTWNSGLCLFFYTPPSVYGFADSLNLTNRDMEASFDSWYQRFVPDKYNVSALYPAANGLSVKNVTDLLIYPPHRYDFNTTGDTDEWAYEGGVSGVPTSATVPSTAFSSTSEIADNDSSVYWTNTTDDGKYAAQRFVFTLKESAANVERLNVTWKGSGTHDNVSATQGADLYIWNGGSSSYEKLADTSSNSTTTLTGGNASVATNYVVDGNVTVLVMQKSAQQPVGEDGKYYSHLATDHVKLVVTHHHSNS